MLPGFLRKLLLSDGHTELQPEDARAAIAAVLVMAARADGKYDAAEEAMIDRALMSRFKLTAAQALAEKLSGMLVTVARKAGVDGRLFGSVTNHDVADGLTALGFEVEKSDIRMPMGPIKTVSETSLEISLHTDVLATIRVAVVGEQ